jgi:hypothetical protein
MHSHTKPSAIPPRYHRARHGSLVRLGPSVIVSLGAPCLNWSQSAGRCWGGLVGCASLSAAYRGTHRAATRSDTRALCPQLKAAPGGGVTVWGMKIHWCRERNCARQTFSGVATGEGGESVPGQLRKLAFTRRFAIADVSVAHPW